MPDTKINPKGIGVLCMIFTGLQIYGGNWNLKSSRPFDAEEISAVKSAKVVASDYGKSVCFLMVSGGQTYIPLSTQSTLEVGDTVDLNTAQILTLERDGNGEITRVQA